MSMKIEQLMPPQFKVIHSRFVSNFVLVGQENIINKFSHLWAVDHKGYCFSINLIVKVVPDKVGYMLLGNLFKLNEDHYALTD